MSFNPPDTRDEIRDTLVFMGIPYTYEKITGDAGHVFTFHLPKKDNLIAIFGPKSMKLDKKKFKSTYDLKRAIMAEYNELL
jgi:hypothetical protein